MLFLLVLIALIFLLGIIHSDHRWFVGIATHAFSKAHGSMGAEFPVATFFLKDRCQCPRGSQLPTDFYHSEHLHLLDIVDGLSLTVR